MEKYRFDDAYQKVYEYDPGQKAYLFVGTYLVFGITSKMSHKKKVSRVEGDPEPIMRLNGPWGFRLI
jgi:hypothetical protein